MGNTNKKERKEAQVDNINPLDTETIEDGFDDIVQKPIDKIWCGTKQKCPMMFYLRNNLWDEEFKTYCKHLMDSVSELFNITLSKETVNIIITGYLKTHIQRRWYPRKYILNSLPKQNSLIPANFHNSRRSQSVINDSKGKNNIIQYLIEYFDLHVSLKQLNKTKLNMNEKWDTYFKNDDFLLNEIVIYQKGDYFKKHIDTMYEETDENNVIHKYDYTLIIIAPNNYKGGELIIYPISDKDTNNEIVIGCNNNLWQWILFPKIRKHQCTKLLHGKKIIFKFHIASHSFASYDGYDIRYNVAYEPMANDFVAKPKRHKNPFIDRQLWSDSD